MNANLQTIVDSSTNISSAATAAQADFDQLEKEYEALQTDLTSVNQENDSLTKQVQQLQDQLSSDSLARTSDLDDIAAGRWPLIDYSDLHRHEMIPGTKEVLFKWLQPGNVGNTLGGSPDPHGTSTWTTNPTGATTIQANPTVIDGKKSDDFYYYMPLPFPSQPRIPRRYAWKATNYSCATEGDWANSQALEFQNQIIIAGHVHNMGWQFDHVETKGMRYFNYVNSVWVPAPHIPLPDMGQPCSVLAEFSIDPDAHTTTHEAITLNGTRYPVNVTQPCGTKAVTVNKFTTSVQLDCKASAPSYRAVLDGFEVRAL